MYLKQLVILFLFLVQFAQAQTTPQVCARLLLGSGLDSISWQATPCAGFGGYVLLGQENNIGPFATIDTFFTTTVTHSNPSENPWHYQVGMLCNGVLSNLSFIVSNQRPVTPDLLSVNIVGNSLVISWNPSPSPEVISYQLYKENPYGSGNYFPYPSATSTISGTTYTDVNPPTLLARFALTAISVCNKSLLGIGNAADGTTGPHTSMVVSGNIDTCNQKILFSWNAYENWKDGVEHYEIWLNKNGAGFAPVDTVSKNTLTYVYTNAQDNDLLIFQIRAREKNKNNSAFSNNLTFDVRVNRPMDYLYIKKLSVTTNNDIEIEWEWDIDVDFAGANLLSGTSVTNLTSRLTLPVIGSAINNFTDNQVSPHHNSYFYQVIAQDACEHVVNSNLAETIFLKVEALENFENKISWSPANIEYGTVQEYWVYKLINNSPQRIAIVGTSDLSYIDQLDLTNQAEAENCYFVVANISFVFPNGTTYFSQSQSNQGCAVQGSNIHIPNAVSPNGKNKHFRPIIVFSQSIYNYTMVIYDRYGQQIFESHDLYDAWDGTQNGQPLHAGVYVYLIRFQAPNGEWIERKGTVTLVL